VVRERGLKGRSGPPTEDYHRSFRRASPRSILESAIRQSLVKPQVVPALGAVPAHQAHVPAREQLPEDTPW
jgi:hypothetical protein